MVDFIISGILAIYHWWKNCNKTKLQLFFKNCIASILVAWATSTFFMSLFELFSGFVLVTNLQTTEQVNTMSYKMARIIFWIFAIVIGIGVYLGLRAVLIDIIRKTKDGYKDTFILRDC